MFPTDDSHSLSHTKISQKGKHGENKSCAKLEFQPGGFTGGNYAMAGWQLMRKMSLEEEFENVLEMNHPF